MSNQSDKNFCIDHTASSDWLFGLWPGPPQRFEPTGTDTFYQSIKNGWPHWGHTAGRRDPYADLSIGACRCNQGHTYQGTDGEICGGDNNWGKTDVEVWFAYCVDDADCGGHGACAGAEGVLRACHCDSGWSGIRCTHPTGCDGNPCGANGRCAADAGAHTCSCDEGWNGTSCDHPTGCDSAPCLHGGTCTAAGCEHTCQCESRWAGTDCDICQSQAEHVRGQIHLSLHGGANLSDAMTFLDGSPSGAAVVCPLAEMQHYVGRLMVKPLQILAIAGSTNSTRTIQPSDPCSGHGTFTVPETITVVQTDCVHTGTRTDPWNELIGKYKRDGDVNGRPQWAKHGIKINWEAGFWRLTGSGRITRYTTKSDAQAPPRHAWIATARGHKPGEQPGQSELCTGNATLTVDDGCTCSGGWTGPTCLKSDAPRLWARFEVNGELFLTGVTIRDQDSQNVQGHHQASVNVRGGGRLVATGVSFLRLVANMGGGAAVEVHDRAEFYSCVFDGCHATTPCGPLHGDGGAISFYGGAVGVIADSAFRNNFAGCNGGALHLSGKSVSQQDLIRTNVTIKRTHFENNTAYGNRHTDDILVVHPQEVRRMSVPCPPPGELSVDGRGNCIFFGDYASLNVVLPTQWANDSWYHSSDEKLIHQFLI